MSEEADLISRQADQIEAKIIAYRRDLHKYAEAGWTEFRTASLVAQRLEALGYEVNVGRVVMAEGDRMGLPSREALDLHWLRALEQGGDHAYMAQMRGGFTGLVGVLRNGVGPTVGMRFDLDALDIAESPDAEHRPNRENYASVNTGVMHACGHDGHTAIGLGVAETLLAVKDHLQGTVKLIFQPAEEGVRGAKSMVSAGVLDDVDYLLGHHLFSGWPTGELAGGVSGFLATTKFDVHFSGVPAHAGASPHIAKNALMAAATAVLNLYAIPRHRGGITRVNVGRLEAGTGRNIVPGQAHLVVETRGATTELDAYMVHSAVRVVEAAAAMHDCQVEIKAMGSAYSADSDPELAHRVERVAAEMAGYVIRPPQAGGGSEDFTYMMERVQSRGGQATSIGIGADLGGWGHHTERFDLDERALKGAVKLLSLVTLDILAV